MLAGTGCAAHRQGARHAAAFVRIDTDAGIVLSNGDGSLRREWRVTHAGQRRQNGRRDACAISTLLGSGSKRSPIAGQRRPIKMCGIADKRADPCQAC